MKKALLPIFLVLFLAPAVAQEIFSKSDEAIQGYDPVAYFKEGRPVKGKKELAFVWKGANWHFASQQNMEDFKSSPEKYAPQYGGYCAYGTAEGHKAPTSPDAWTIVNNKLYLNYDKNVQSGWSKDRETLIKKADKNWPEVKKQKD